jgi:hypothetical protein
VVVVLIPTSILPLDVPTKTESQFSSSNNSGDCWILNKSSLSTLSSLLSISGDVDGRRGLNSGCGECECILDSISIFSSFSSSKSFSSRTSASNALTLSSNDSVYPLGNARRLNLSLVLHSKPTLMHCEQLGRMPSQRIFLERQRSHACAMRAWAALPTLMTFMGRMPGMVGDAVGRAIYRPA